MGEPVEVCWEKRCDGTGWGQLVARFPDGRVLCAPACSCDDEDEIVERFKRAVLQA